MSTYFGYPANGADPVGATQDLNTVLWIRNKNYTTGFSCPGSGLQNVTELSAWVRFIQNTPHIRIAVYDNGATPTLMAQGNAAVLISGGPSWQGHVGAAAITQTTALTGGVTYLLGYTKDSFSNNEYYIAGSANDYEFIAATEYTAGWPSTLSHTGTTGSAVRYCIRCGVEAAAAPTIDQEGYRFYADGTEDGSTPSADQDAECTVAVDTIQHLRVLLNTVSDVDAAAFQLEYDVNASGNWRRAN